MDRKMPLEKKLEELPIALLLKIGKKVAGSDYAVSFYYKKNHPKFHLNKEALLKAIRRGIHTNGFVKKEDVWQMIEENE